MMAKRVAEEYITKDQGSTPNFTDPQEGGPVRMATPAQLAARKLKTPKSRLGTRGNSTAGAGFGSIAASAPNPFAQPQQQQQQATFAPPSSSFTFGAPNGQISFGQNAAQASTPSVFGQSNGAQNSSFTFGQTSTPFSFSSDNTSKQNTEPPQSAPPSFTFGQPAQTNGIFSGFNFAANGSTSAPQTSGPPTFGQSTQMEDTTMFSPPRKTPADQQAFSPASAETPKPLFQFKGPVAQPASSLAQSEGPRPSFSFGAPAEQPAPSPAPAETPKSLFQFTTPAEPQVPSAAPFTAPTKSLFQFSAPAAAEQTLGSATLAEKTKSLFSFQAPTEQPVSSTTPTEAPTKSPFQFSAPALTESPVPSATLVENPTQAPKEASKPLFQFQTPNERSGSPVAPAETSKSLFSSQAPVDKPAFTPASKPKSLFDTPGTVDESPASFAATQSTHEPQQPASSAVDKAPIEFEKVKLRSNGPSEPLMTDDHSKWTEHDQKYRLRSLNKELVRRLALYDPGSQDFDNVIIFYYQTREKLGLLWPPCAKNTKRKADEEHGAGGQSSTAKKTKTSESSDRNTQPTSNVFSSVSSSISSAPYQTPKGNSTAANTGLTNSVKAPSDAASAPPKFAAASTFKGPSSGTSTLFESMLSAPSPTAESSKLRSPFANVPTQPQPAAKPVFSFSQPSITKVTSPTKPVSPPTSDEVEDDGDGEEQESEEEEDAEGEEEEQDSGAQSGRSNENGSEEDDEDDDDDEQAPPSMPENFGRSLFDRIQPPTPAGGEQAATTPNGVGTQGNNVLKQPAPNHSFKPFTPFGPGVTKSTPQAPTVSPITPFGGSIQAKPAATFQFTPKEPTTTPTPIPGASIFAGGSVKSNGPLPGDGLFGSRPSTPNNDGPAPTNIFAGFSKMPNTTINPSKDNTWSKGSPLKFDTPQKSTTEGFKFSGGTSTNFMQAFGKTAEQHEAADKAKQKYEDLGSDAEEDEIEQWEKEYEEKKRAKRAKTSEPSSFGQGGFKPAIGQIDGPAKEQASNAPSVSITAATPPPKGTGSSNKFTNLFGQKSDAASPAPPVNNPVGFSFGAAPTGPSALQPAASYLFPSANTSGLSSRATSPGATDTESVGTDGEADATDDPQTSLMSDRPGEENEEVLYETRTKALKFMDEQAAAKQKGTTPNAYNSVGLGILRVLKNAETNKARIVIRAEPGANVLLNTNLTPFISYTSDSRAAGSGVVRFGVPTENDKIEQWVLKVKNSEKANELAEVLTNNKSLT